MKNFARSSVLSILPHRRIPTLAMLAATCLALLGGCKVHRLVSRDYWKEEFTNENPYDVLRDSNDGNKRARALTRIEEPVYNGGTQKQQDLVVDLLARAARSEPEVFSRLSAIQTMAKFKDPRVVDGLVDAYYAGDLKDYPAESAHVIRVQVINALARVSPGAAGMNLLKAVLNQPEVDRDTSELKKQQTLDERIAAARALTNYRNKESTELLTQVLQREKNVALRDRARESLQVVSGVRPGPDAPFMDRVIEQFTPARDRVVESEPAKLPVVLTGGREQQ